MTIPAFVICRDLVTWTKRTVAGLEAQPGIGPIYLVDNDSTFPPLLSYYRTTPHTVIRLGGNYGKRGPWKRGIIRRHARRGPFIVTDPDIEPMESCPDDWLEHFLEALDRYPDIAKVGFGLHLDDLPAKYQFRAEVLQRSRQFEDPKHLTPCGEFYRIPLDTTLAVYRAGTPYCTTPALRSAAPYQARHLAWYLNSAKPSKEVLYYRNHADQKFGHWAKSRLPKRLAKHLGRDFGPSA